MKKDMECKLEVHAYAPELNKYYIGNTKFMVPGAKTIGDVRRQLFHPLKPGIYMSVWTEYPPDKAWLNRSYNGMLTTPENGVVMNELKTFMDLIRKRLAPEGVVKAKIKLIG